MPPMLAAWAASLELSGLPDETAAIARSYLGRCWELRPAAREEFGRLLAAEVAGHVSPPPPPGTAPAAYLSAVLAERRAREEARMNRVTRAGDSGTPGYGTASHGTPGTGPASPPAPAPSPAAATTARPGGGEPPSAGGFTPPA